jgi:hypothetical protein
LVNSLVGLFEKRGQFDTEASDHPLPLSQQANTRPSTPLRVGGENRGRTKKLTMLDCWKTFSCHYPLYSLSIQHLQYRQEVVKPYQRKKPISAITNINCFLQALF